MSDLVAELSKQARMLSTQDRARLAEELLASVHDEDVDPEIEAAWGVELQRRIAEIDNGTAKLVPADEVFAEIRRLIK